MTNMKVADLTGAALDAAVAKALPDQRIGTAWGVPWIDDGSTAGHGQSGRAFQPSTDWRDGGPIIERERIATWPAGDGFCARHPTAGPYSNGCGYMDAELGVIDCRNDEISGATLLEAAMRCYVASKFGETVDLDQQAEVATLAAATEGTPNDWANPNWPNAGRVHEWKNYVSQELQEMWPSLGEAQKQAIARHAEQIANREHWD